MTQKMDLPFSVRGSLGHELRERHGAATDRCGGRDVDDVRLEVLSGLRKALCERTLDMSKVVVCRQFAEAEHSRRQVKAMHERDRTRERDGFATAFRESTCPDSPQQKSFGLRKGRRLNGE